MRAAARIVAEAKAGATRLTVLRGESPLLLRRTGPPARVRPRTGADAGTRPPTGPDAEIHPPTGPDAGATVHLVGGAAGPLRGDDLLLEIEVGPGANLEIRSVAATLLLPGRPAPPSRLVVRATVAGTLRWRPEPTIAAAGCDHHAITEVDVAEGGTLLWRDDLVCGRHNEPSGAVRSDTTVRYAGRTLYRHRLTVGPGAPGWSGAAVLGDAGATGSVVMAGPDLPEPHRPAGGAAVMRLSGPGLLATAVGRDIRDVRAALDPLCAARTPAMAA
ncbi:urease accessory protein UreD [Actinoplanes sp. NPDC049265]|uniref:urease accessory protein UreD n=1 Tax=Actinoplanes sp. NPDC049265 TaxID=3363902 RepID=UPI00371F1D3D